MSLETDKNIFVDMEDVELDSLTKSPNRMMGDRNGFYLNFDNVVVLKHSNILDNSDNIIYEYLTSICVNRLRKYYPFFTQTIGLLKYREKSIFNTIAKSNSKIVKFSTTQSLDSYFTNVSNKKLEKLINSSITDSRYLYCILFKYVNIKTNLFDYILSKSKNDIYMLDKIDSFSNVVIIYYLVYLSIANLSNLFTHYDLNIKNIGFWRVPSDKCIDVFVNDRFMFKTKYLPIIFDFARSWINCSDTPNSHNILSLVGKKKSIRKNGYNFVGDYIEKSKIFRDTNIDDFYINSAKRNRSHDLTAIANLYNTGLIHLIEDYINIDYIKKFVKMVFSTNYDHINYGINELESVGSIQVRNVFDAKLKLYDIIISDTFKTTNIRYIGDKSIYANLYLYDDNLIPWRIEYL